MSRPLRQLSAEKSRILNQKINNTHNIKVNYVFGADLYYKSFFDWLLRKVFADKCPSITETDDYEEADIIVSSLMYYRNRIQDKEKLQKMYHEPLKVTIMISGEPISIAEHAQHYDITLDTKTITGVPTIYCPHFLVSFFERRKNTKWDLLKKSAPIAPKTKFCAYLTRVCQPHREKFFDALSKYRAVDALGTCCVKRNANGVCQELETDRYTYNNQETYNDLAVEKYRPYKFVIAFENSDHRGYITEKIVNPMLAGCIPIYWGNSDVKYYFNPKSFIYVGDFANFEACVEYVHKVDTTPELYQQYLAENWLIQNTFNDYLRENNNRLVRDVAYSLQIPC